MTVIGALIALVITLLILGLLWWAVNELIGLVPLPATIRQIIYVLLMVILGLIVIYILLYLLSTIGVNVPLFHGLR